MDLAVLVKEISYEACILECIWIEGSWKYGTLHDTLYTRM
jgi:hypothetical protein